MKEKRSIPLGVKILSILYYINSAFMLLLGILLFFLASIYPSLLESGELEQGLTAEELAGFQALGDITWLIYVMALVVIIIAVLNLFLGIAFWKGQNWGRIVTIIFAILGIPFALFNLVSAFSIANTLSIVIILIQIGIDVGIIWYLLQKDVIHFFTSKKKD